MSDEFPIQSTVVTERVHRAVDVVHSLLDAPLVPFADLKSRTISSDPGVYAIIDLSNGEPLYIGQSISLSQRIYGHHLMGGSKTAQIKSILQAHPSYPSVATPEDAKRYVAANFGAKTIVVQDKLLREAAAALALYVFQPRLNLFK